MEYEVSLRNTFEADNPVDAVAQMIEWVINNAYSTGYRVTTETGLSLFIDGEGRILMDPDVLLVIIREQIALLERPMSYGETAIVAREMGEAIRDLDKWICGGGFLPEAWADGLHLRRPKEVASE